MRDGQSVRGLRGGASSKLRRRLYRSKCRRRLGQFRLLSTNPGCPPSATNATFCGAAPDPSGTERDGRGGERHGRSLPSAGIHGRHPRAVQNWQYGNIVFGGEGDFGAFNLGKSANPTGVFPFPFLGTAYALNESMSTDWLITLRGRLGYTVRGASSALCDGGRGASPISASQAATATTPSTRPSPAVAGLDQHLDGPDRVDRRWRRRMAAR